MSEQSKTPQWVKVALAIQAIVICAGLLLYVASIRLVSHVQLPTRAENRAFVEVSTDAPAAASPNVPGQPSGVYAAPPNLIQSTPSPYGPDSDPSLGPVNFLPAPSLSTPMESDTAVVNPTLSNAQPSNPPNSKTEHSNEEVTNQTASDSEAPNSNPSAVIETAKQETFPDSKNQIRVFRLQRGSSGEMSKTVKEIFDNLVKVSADERSNSLIVVASPPTLEKVADFIEGMERLAKIAFVEEMKRQDVEAQAKRKSSDGHETATIEIQPTPAESLLAKQQALQKLMRAFGKNHPKVRAVQDQIEAEQARLAAESPKQEPQRDAVIVNDVQNPVGKFPSDELDAEFDRQSRQLALQIRTARPNEKAKLKKELEAITRKQFEHRQDRRREEFDSLGQRVERLKASYQRRQSHQNEVIQRRINDLLDPNTDLRWDETEMPADSLSIRDEGANAIEAVTQDTFSVRAMPSEKTLPANLDQPESTYNSVTLSQWMRLLETERNLEKIAEAVTAMNHLIDQADPTQLTRAILRVMRVHGSRTGDVTTSVIRNGSVNLLKLLPGEIVVEELIAELAASSSRKPTQDFCGYFLNSVRSQGATDTHYGIGSNVFMAVDSTTVSNANQRLSVEIRRRSRRLIGVLVNAANTDEGLAKWAMLCAGHVVHISDQPITKYPDLIPLVEKLFDHPVDVQKGASWFYSRAVAAILLGESGLRVSDVQAFAAKRIEDEGYILAPKYAANSMRCLVAVAPFSPDAVNLFGRTLEEKWGEVVAFDKETKAFSTRHPLEETIEVDKKGPPDESNGKRLKEQCKRIIEALAEIGNPAVPVIPKLTAIAEFPAIVEGPIESVMGGFGGMRPGQSMTFQDLAKSAIKKIEEAKPKPDPQPLPEDIEFLKQVPIIAVGKPGVSPVTDQPLRDLVTPLADPKPTETTYDGITYSQWLKLLETERKPEKLIAAIGTCSLLAAKGDERRIARQIFLAEGFFETENWSNERRSAWDAGSDALARLPGDAVIDEFLYALRDEKSFSAGRGFQAFFLTRTEAIPHAEQMRFKAAEVIAELLKRHATLSNPKETHNSMLVAASSVWRNSGKPMKDFDGLSPQLTKLLADGFSIKNTPEFEQWMIAARNVVVGAPDTPDLANLLLAHAKKHDPYGYPLIELIGKLGPRAEPVVSELVDLFLEKLKKLELLPALIGRTGQGVTYLVTVPNGEELNLQRVIAMEDQKMRVQLIRTIGEIGVGASGYQLLSELKLIAFRPSSQRYFEFLDEIFLAVDKSLSQFGATKYPRDEKRLLSDLWRLNGRWKVVTRFDNTAAAEPPQDFIVQIRDNQFSWETAPPKGHILNEFMNSLDIRRSNMTYKVTVIDAMSPKQLMLAANVRLPPGQGAEGLRLTMAGIYELSDDTLKIQFAKPDQPSPTEFTNETGQVPEGQMLLEFERIVPEAVKNPDGQE